MSITTSGSGESRREAHKARRTLVRHSILFTARRLGFAYTFWRARGGLLKHVEGVECISRGYFTIYSQLQINSDKTDYVSNSNGAANVLSQVLHSVCIVTSTQTPISYPNLTTTFRTVLPCLPSLPRRGLHTQPILAPTRH
jgi:hypothetical protein